jgi:hypothetical protein
VTVEEGQTLVPGGLRQQEMAGSASKVPVLGDLPLLGPLFKREEKAVRDTVLTIFITPRIMRPDNPVPERPQLNPEDVCEPGRWGLAGKDDKTKAYIQCPDAADHTGGGTVTFEVAKVE